MEATTLRPEQFRAVTPITPSPNEASYQYMSVPLTFLERKRLSDSLFMYSQEVEHWMDECGDLLHGARERDQWDLAVAELLTQVVVALFCGEGDKRLDGLQKYLLHSVGISC